VFVCLWVCYHDNSKLRASILTKLVGKGSDHLQLIKVLPYRAPGKGSAVGRKFSALPYYIQRAVFTSLWALFHLIYLLDLCKYMHVCSTVLLSFSTSFELYLAVSRSHCLHHRCWIMSADMTSDAAFPTPMDEPRKVMSCHFLGTLPVSMATGILFVAVWQLPYFLNDSQIVHMIFTVLRNTNSFMCLLLHIWCVAAVVDMDTRNAKL